MYGRPLIDIRNGSRLILGDGVLLNSRNRGYHVNMYGPVKLFADRPGAIISIGNMTRIHGSCIHAWRSVQIGQRCLIAANCQILDSNGHDCCFGNVTQRIHTSGSARPVAIEDDVWVGANSMVLPGVTIGRGSIIAAGSVVVGDVPPMAIARGNPATVVAFSDDETIQQYPAVP